ncbi:MAG: transglycosylase family protein [Actinomycetota bacterium]
MKRTFFGPRASRRQRFKRRLGVSLLATTASLLIGIPAGVGPLNALGVFGADAQSTETKPAKGMEASDSHASIVRFRREVFKERERPVKPEPQPTPAETEELVEAAPVAPAGSIEEIIGTAATEFGLDPAYLIGVASCESELDPGAYNAAGYHGLFQFDEQTWSAYGYGSIWDASAQSRTAARLIAAGEAGRWPNCA